MNSRLFLRPLPLLLLLASACTDRNNRETAPQGECRLERITTTATSSLYRVDEQTAYDYDGAGHLLKKTTTSRIRYADPQLARTANSDRTTTTQFRYDPDGFLQTSEYTATDQFTDTKGQAVTDTHSSKLTYAYANGRLAGYTQQDVSSRGTTTTSSNAYEYDAAGNLTRLKRTLGTNTTYAYAFDRGVLTGYVEISNGAETRPFAIQNGLVTSYTLPGGWRGAYQYDGQGRLVKQEEFINGQLQSYFTQAYADGKPAAEAEPKFKGFPAVGAPGSSPWFGRAGLPASKKQYFTNSLTGTEQFYSETTWANRLNDRGFVENAVKTEAFKNPQTLPQRVEATTTYTYTGRE